MTNAISCGDFTEWVKQAKPNEKMIYYIGDCLTETLLSNDIRKHTFDAALRGLVYLVQRRNGMLFSYLAIRASSPPLEKLVPTKSMTNLETQKKPASNRVRVPKERVYPWQPQRRKMSLLQ